MAVALLLINAGHNACLVLLDSIAIITPRIVTNACQVQCQQVEVVHVFHAHLEANQIRIESSAHCVLLDFTVLMEYFATNAHPTQFPITLEPGLVQHALQEHIQVVIGTSACPHKIPVVTISHHVVNSLDVYHY